VVETTNNFLVVNCENKIEIKVKFGETTTKNRLSEIFGGEYYSYKLIF